ncbi:MAB_1171c family putative transporter [Actinoplanes sp. NPDC000266]
MTRPDYVVAALIAFVACGVKLRQLRRDPHNPALRAICGALAALGLCVVVGWPPLYVALDEATGLPNIARYIEHSISLVAAASVQTLFLFLGDPERAPRRVQIRWIALGVAVAVMGAAFAQGKFNVEAPLDFATRYANTPQLSQYMLAFLAFLLVTMYDILRRSAQYGQQLPPSLLRLGTRLLLAGSVVGLIYVAHKATFLICRLLDLPLSWDEGPVSQTLLLLGITLVAGGLVIPGIGPYLTDVWQWPRRYRLYTDMMPLWEDIHGVVRDVNLHPPRRRPSIRLMSVALYRRVIEIRDGLRELRKYVNATVVSHATQLATEHELPARDARATGEAAGIAVMLDYVIATPADARKPLADKSATRVTQDAGDSLDEDAQWLASVSRAYAQSPIVAEVRRAQRPTAP